LSNLANLKNNFLKNFYISDTAILALFTKNKNTAFWVRGVFVLVIKISMLAQPLFEWRSRKESCANYAVFL